MGVYEEIEKALKGAFIQGQKEARLSSSFSPTFLYNDKEKNKKVLNNLVDELRKCDEFKISVAFITMRGLQLLKGVFEELKNKGIKGKILTTDYLAFTEPKALKFIRDFLPNIEIRIYQTNDSNVGFHTKGYLIKQDKIYKLIIGSSNITDNALTINKEWNTELVSTEEGNFVKEVLNEYDLLWSKAKDLNEYIDIYEKIYAERQHFSKKLENINSDLGLVEPNYMQLEFILNLKKMLENKERRGLLISATGTGKTFASAFALKEVGAKKILFLAHRTQLLTQAISTFRIVFGKDLKIALLTGDSSIKIKDKNVIPYKKGADFDILFSTCLMAKKTMTDFEPDCFDFMVIDEVHHAGSDTYRSILNYFTPKFSLGMTATPERTNEEALIFDLFDNNIIFEIRLQDALDYNLLCPFHYYGITDIKGVNDETYKKEDLNLLYSEERINYILSKAQFYGYSGDRLRGLIFTSRRKDGEMLEEKLNEKGLKTKFLSGDLSTSERNKYIEMLEKPRMDGDYLDYIITVDIFNEGVDVPEVNQIIMLRPTESSIVFIQQLGRGLRKWTNKDYVVILDFIGNYDTNYMIPKAFSRSGSRVEARMIVSTNSLPGVSTIEFDEISRQKIFDSITKNDFDTFKDFKSEYLHLKNKINRIPSLCDFVVYTSFDPYRIINKYDSYQAFINRVEKKNIYTAEEIKYFKLLSECVGKGLRKTEALFLNSLLNNENFVDFSSNDEKETVINEFSGKFSFSKLNIKIIDDENTLNNDFKKLFETSSYFKDAVLDLIEFSFKRHNIMFKNKYRNSPFSLFAEYNRRDVSVLLNTKKDRASTLYGYQYLKESNTFPIFVNYHKAKDIDESINYDDHFINERTFNWNARDKESSETKNMQILINSMQNYVKIYLFVRKCVKDSGDNTLHYFLGEVEVLEYKNITRNNKSNMNYIFGLKDEVSQNIYNYITSIMGDEYEDD